MGIEDATDPRRSSRSQCTDRAPDEDAAPSARTIGKVAGRAADARR